MVDGKYAMLRILHSAPPIDTERAYFATEIVSSKWILARLAFGSHTPVTDGMEALMKGHNGFHEIGNFLSLSHCARARARNAGLFRA